MTSILVKENDILTVTTRTRIMQKSKLFQNLRFVVESMYYGHDMAEATVVLEYRLPDKKYKTEYLSLSEELLDGFYVYNLPVDTELTANAGKIELQLSFYYVGLDEEGNSVQKVRKTTGTTIDIIPIAAWADIIPDEALTALDQRILKNEATAKMLAEMMGLGEDGVFEQVDNLSYNPDTGELQLMAGDAPIGDSVNIGEAMDEDGIPVVDFSEVSGDDDGDDEPDEESNVVEF